MRLYCRLFQSFKFIYYFCACLVFIFFNFLHIFLFSLIFDWMSFTTAANVMNWNGNTTTNDRFSIFCLILPFCFSYFLYKCSFTMLLFYRAFIVLPGQFIKKNSFNYYFCHKTDKWILFKWNNKQNASKWKSIISME